MVRDRPEGGKCATTSPISRCQAHLGPAGRPRARDDGANWFPEGLPLRFGASPPDQDRLGSPRARYRGDAALGTLMC
jgi:hypothetical protein